MLSNIHYINRPVNAQSCNLGVKIGHAFENKIYNILVSHLNTYFDKGVKILQTPGSRDDGKDIIIKSQINLPDLLNYSFEMRGKSEITIYIECKSSNNGQISYTDVIGNAVKTKRDGIDYFVLVTNTCVTPYTHYEMNEELKAYGVELVLIDQYLLYQYVTLQKNQLGKYLPLNFIPKIEIEYQTLKRIENNHNGYELYLVFRNYTKEPHHLSFNLLTDQNWDVNAPLYETILPSYGSAVKKIIVTRKYTDGIEDLIFKIKMDNYESQFHIQGKDMVQFFEPSFIGQKRIQLRESLLESLRKKEKIFYLYGNAGMGKTRLVNEVYKKLEGRNFDLGFFKVVCNKTNIINQIHEFLNKIYQIENNNDLFNLIYGSTNAYGRHAVILIDDLHNARKELLQDIKKLSKGYSAPISIILCGRTDYSAGNSDYFSFAQWAIESPTIISYELEALDKEDTQNLIRTIINDVPDIVLKKLTKLSQNNPLYIVQYIEYLLEMDLLTIVNKHTVGIQNIDRFTSHDYMPNTVEEIYVARWNHLLKPAGTTKMRNLMLACTVNHGSLTNKQVIVLLNENMEPLNTLLKRRFMQIDNNGNYGFIHESLLLFISCKLHKNKTLKKQIANIFLRYTTLMDKMSQLDKGMIALWGDNAELSLKYFTPTIKLLQSIQNHSSFNVNIEIYEYLYYIYELLNKKIEYTQTIKKIILTRIYIALHYYTPQKAIYECELAIFYLKQSLLGGEKQLYNTLLEHQAHSYINAGQLANAELILKQLHAWWLIQPNSMSSDTVFDMYDKFCGIYIRQNCKELATAYNTLSIQQAMIVNDDNLLALAYITQAKMLFYSNSELCWEKLMLADQLLQNGISMRILCHNNVTKLVHNCVYEKIPNWDNIQKDANRLLDIAIDNSFGNSVIRIYMLLALCCFKRSVADFSECQRYISQGIDASILFGISTFIWQLYNLRAIVYIRSGYNANEVMKLFDTILAILDRQGLIYLGNCDFCYGNMLAISNIAFFWQANKMETMFYKKIVSINFIGSKPTCDYDCAKPACAHMCFNATDLLKRQYKKAQQKQILFYEKKHNYTLRDEHTQYFIIIS